MKKVFLLSMMVLGGQLLLAQYDPQAKAVLDAMSSKYKSAGAFSAKFSQKIENPTAGIDEEIEGKITVKGSMYKLEIVGTEIYNNGKEVWQYSPEIKEATVSNFDPSEEEITPGNVYDLYKKGFKYVLISTMGNGDRVVELNPESKDKSYFKIRLFIDAQNQLKTFTVFEKSGTKYIYTVQDFKSLSGIADSFFTFNPAKYPGVEVIDFR